MRKIGFTVAIAIFVVMVGSLAIRGLNQGIDFSGGRNYVVRFDKPVKPVEISEMLKPAFEGSSLSVITITSDDLVRISTNYRIADQDENIDKEIETKL